MVGGSSHGGSPVPALALITATGRRTLCPVGFPVRRFGGWHRFEGFAQGFGGFPGLVFSARLRLLWRFVRSDEVKGRGSGFRAADGLPERRLVVGDPRCGQAGAGGRDVSLFA